MKTTATCNNGRQPRTFFILAIVLSLTGSCKKESLLPPTVEKDPLTEAKTFFEKIKQISHVDTAGKSHRQKLTRTVKWDEAYLQTSDDTTIIFAPVALSERLYVESGGIRGVALSDYVWLRAIRTRDGRPFQYHLITLVPAQGTSSAFTGTVLVEEWFGDRATFRFIRQGTPHAAKEVSSNSIGDMNLSMAMAPDPDLVCFNYSYQSCITVESPNGAGSSYTHCTTHYERFCVEGGDGDGPYPGGDGSGGAGEGTGGNVAPYFVVESPPAEKIELSKRLGCFNQIPNAGATYGVQLHVDLAKHTNPHQEVNGLDAGHVYLTLTKTNGNLSHTFSFGFYPTSSAKSITHVWLESQIADESKEALRESNIHINMSGISRSQFTTILNRAVSASLTYYHIRDYNCADYALEIFNSIRPTGSKITVLDSHYMGQNIGTSPAGVYRVLETMRNNGDGSIKKETKKPISSPGC